MVSKIKIEQIEKASNNRKITKKKVTDASKMQSRETHLKTRFFIYLFRKRFKEYFDEEYELKEQRYYKDKVILSDKRRLSIIRWKLSLRQDNPVFWIKYIDYVIDRWESSEIKNMNNLVGFLENKNIMKTFFLESNIQYRKDKSLNKIAGHTSKNQHISDWQN